MDFSNLQALVIPEGEVTKIAVGDIILWEAIENVAEIINWLPKATATDRKTIFGGDYNGDGKNDGYVTGKRLSSSGSEATLTGMCCSGFIPAEPGDILRIKGTAPKTGTASYVITYNSSNTKVAHQGVYQDNNTWVNSASSPWQKVENGVLQITLDSNFGTGFDAIRFSAGTIDANTIVTINQEIVD